MNFACGGPIGLRSPIFEQRRKKVRTALKTSYSPIREARPTIGWTAAGKGWFADAAEAAGLKGKVTVHGLRHLFAVRLLMRGAPITVVSELLGHSDINLTVKRYGRFACDAKVTWDAVKMLDLDLDEPSVPAFKPRLTMIGGRK